VPFKSFPGVDAAYVHIPFCRRRCYYCDFPVFVLGDHRRGEQSGTVVHYLDALSREIQLTPNFGQPLQTVFLGGGTPSLLSVRQLDRILTQLSDRFGIAANAELSIEMDPGTFDLAQLEGYRAAGINRISVGVQAFQPDLLQRLGRTHTVADVYNAIDLIDRAGLDNVSLDLISGLPHQTPADWMDSLAKALALAPSHLSIYDLIVEPGTPFSRQYQPGDAPLPSDSLAADLYRSAQQMLTAAGYEHYEISNYARSSYHCRHNRVYWENRPFYGFGMGAASYLWGDRLTRPRTTQTYHNWVQHSAPAYFQMLIDRSISDPPLTSLEQSDQVLETLMLGLRLADGIDVTQLATQLTADQLQTVWNCLHPHISRGWVELISPDISQTPEIASFRFQPGRLRLTDPEGFLFSNTILSDLFSVLE
jgi:putative oxygen-independent coproporphyrinogen III oxidase